MAALTVPLARVCWSVRPEPDPVPLTLARPAVDATGLVPGPGSDPCPSEDDTIGTVRDGLRRMRTMGPADKGAADELLCRLIALLSPANVAAIVRSLPQDDMDTPFAAAALECWLKADGAEAAKWIAARPGATTEVHAWVVAHALVQQPEILAAFCDDLGTHPWGHALLDHASREVLRTNPTAAVSLAENLPPGDRQTRLLETIAHDWMDRDPPAAFAWITHMSEDGLRERLISVGARSYASTNPLQALEWLLVEAAPDAGALLTAPTIFTSTAAALASDARPPASP